MEINEGTLSQINSITRFLTRSETDGYVFASQEYDSLIPALNERIIQQAAQKGKKVALFFWPKDTTDPLETLRAFQEENQVDALIIPNFDEFLRKQKNGELQPEARTFLMSLNFSREALIRLGLPMLWWLSKENLSLVANLANDLFSQRRLTTFFFDLKPELQADNPALATRFQEHLRDPEEYQRLTLRANLLEDQLQEAQARAFPPARIATEIVLPLAQLYSELDLREKALEQLDEYAPHLPATDWQSQASLAEVYAQTKCYEQAITLYQTLLQQAGASTQQQFNWYLDLGDLQKETGQLLLAEKYFTNALNILGENNPGTYEHTRVYNRLGSILQAQGRFDDALKYFEQDLRLTEELYQKNPSSEKLKIGLAIAYERLGDILQAQSKFNDALNYFEQEAQLFEELYQANQQSEKLKNGLAIAYEKRGAILQAQGKVDDALKYYKQRLKLGEELYHVNPQSESIKYRLSIAYEKFGDILQAQGKFDDALKYFEQGTQLFEELYQANPQSLDVVNGYAISLYKLAEIKRKIGDFKEVTNLYTAASKIWAQLHEQTKLDKFSDYLRYVQARLDDLEAPSKK